MERLESSIKVTYFRNVSNADQILSLTTTADASEIKSGIPQHCAVIDLANVVSDFHLRNAILKAVLCRATGSGFRSKTSSFSSEVMYNLSGTGKITETEKQFNISSYSNSIAVVGTICAPEVLSTLNNSDSSVRLAQYESLCALVNGARFDPALLLSDSEFSNDDKKLRLVKMFKITPQEMEISTLEDCVITRLAVKEVM